jgi:hypothetical protein
MSDDSFVCLQIISYRKQNIWSDLADNAQNLDFCTVAWTVIVGNDTWETQISVCDTIKTNLKKMSFEELKFYDSIWNAVST